MAFTPTKGKVNEVATADEFKHAKGLAADGTIVCVDFWADWCGPCKKIAPEVIKLAAEHKDAYFFKVNVEELEDVQIAENVTGMPTFKFWKGDQVIEVKSADLNKIVAALSRLQAADSATAAADAADAALLAAATARLAASRAAAAAAAAAAAPTEVKAPAGTTAAGAGAGAGAGAAATTTTTTPAATTKLSNGTVGVLATVDEFKAAKAIAEDGSIVCVDFWATWCGPCKKIAPEIKKMAVEMRDIHFFKLDVEEVEQVQIDENVAGMPTFKFWKGPHVLEIKGADMTKINAGIAKIRSL